jgi:hypothetical protein
MEKAAGTRWTTIALLLIATPVAAIYMAMESAQVPVERLVANLERDLKSDPTSVEKTINLARLHAMAFALKSPTLPGVVLAKQGATEGAERPWFGPGDSPAKLPERVEPAQTAQQKTDAQKHLKQSLQYYDSALRLDPNNLTALLGHAWMVEQSGDKARARTEYRHLVDVAWATEQNAKRAALGQRFFTEEASGYLIPLLDSKTDAAEIATLQERRDNLRAMPRPITPIAIPLTDDAIDEPLVDPLSRVAFDADGTGLVREWTWLSPNAGWLVYDAQDNGAITSALQWFGNVTFWLFWQNGYEALRALDDDGDRMLKGAELRHLNIWHDRNRNGASDVSEVAPLAAHGIVALSCDYAEGDGVRVAAFSTNGARLADGRTRPTIDVILHQTPVTLTRR